MSRLAQIRFLSRFARAYDPIVRAMGFTQLWHAIGEVAAPAPGERALDVCTGTGGAAFELARRGAQVVALDLAAGMLRCARRKAANGSAPLLVRMDARRLAFGDRAFPLVTCSMALHEMSEPERTHVLGEIARVATDRVVIAEYRVPPPGARRALFRATRAFEYAESDDFEGFVRRDVGARLAAAGLQVTAARAVGPYHVWRCHVGAAG
jgi:ubiquinone/menaquinone biosynthesis C-methylase UbiE